MDLLPVKSQEDILPEYLGTPIEKLLAYHNLAKPDDGYEKAEILIGMCMDNRKQLRVPENFAYIIRTGGGNMRFNEFKVSYTIALGKVTSIALLAHDNCGMVNLNSRKKEFVDTLVDLAGWTPEDAEEHFIRNEEKFEIGDELNFVLSEAKRLRLRYPKIQIAPLFYKLEDNMLYQIKEHTRSSLLAA